MKETIKKELTEAAEYALEELKKAGATGAEISISKNAVDELNADAGEFSLMRTTLGSSLSIAALLGTKKGAAAANRYDKITITETAAAAVAAARESEEDEANYIPPSLGVVEYAIGASSVDLDAMFGTMNGLLDGVKKEFPKIDIMQFITQFTKTYSLYANSSGTRSYRENGVYSTGPTFSARDGDNVTSMSYFDLTAAEFTTPLLSYEYVRRALAEMEPQLHTVPVSGKFVGKILMSPDCAATFLSSLLGATVEDFALIQGTSPWKDKLGECVADSKLSITLDPDDKRIVNSARVSDGYLTEKQVLMENGILKGFMLSRYGAKKTGLPRGTYSDGFSVALGDKSFDELAAGIDRGLYVNRFSGGSPAQNGDFSGVAKNSFLIENGKITNAVSETMISGNLFELFKNITGISREYTPSGSYVVPYMSVDCVTISGK